MLTRAGFDDDAVAAVMSDVQACQRSSGEMASRAPRAAFVPRCNGVPVGLVVVDKAGVHEEEVTRLQACYGLDEYVAYSQHPMESQAQVLHYMLSPLFHSAARFVLQEAMRLTRASLLYYRVYPSELAAPVLGQMIQAKPRRRPQLRPGEVGPLSLAAAEAAGAGGGGVEGGASLDMTSPNATGFSLHFATRKLLSEPKLVCNIRVVIVGASQTGLSLIEALLLVPYLHFTHITLVSSGGLPYPRAPGEMDGFMPEGIGGACAEGYSLKELEMLNMAERINIVDGRFVDIDRDGQAIVLRDGSVVPYDYLVIATGLQDVTDSQRGAIATGDSIGDQLEREDGQMQAMGNDFGSGPLRRRAFFLSTPVDCARLDAAVNDFFWGSEEIAVVYGNTLAAYTAVEALLQRDIPGSRIIMVHPPGAGGGDGGEVKEAQRQANNAPFVDDIVSDAVSESLESLGVTVYSGLNIVRLHAKDGANRSGLSVIFERSGEGEVELTCGVLVCGNERNVHPDVYNAINECGLVYDGRVVVDANFQTVDKRIFAAGPVAKLSRRYGKRRLSFEHFNSRALGETLASSLLRHVDPLAVEDANAAASGDAAEAPMLGLQEHPAAKATLAVLPGGLNYVHIRSGRTDPKGCTLLAAYSALPGKGRSLVTRLRAEDFSQVDEGKANAAEVEGRLPPYATGRGTRYCRVLLDPHGRVMSITYLGREAVEVNNLAHLVNMHESGLSSLEHFYEKGSVDDLISFFRQVRFITVNNAGLMRRRGLLSGWVKRELRQADCGTVIP